MAAQKRMLDTTEVVKWYFHRTDLVEWFSRCHGIIHVDGKSWDKKYGAVNLLSVINGRQWFLRICETVHLHVPSSPTCGILITTCFSSTAVFVCGTNCSTSFNDPAVGTGTGYIGNINSFVGNFFSQRWCFYPVVGGLFFMINHFFFLYFGRFFLLNGGAFLPLLQVLSFRRVLHFRCWAATENLHLLFPMAIIWSTLALFPFSTPICNSVSFTWFSAPWLPCRFPLQPVYRPISRYHLAFMPFHKGAFGHGIAHSGIRITSAIVLLI